MTSHPIPQAVAPWDCDAHPGCRDPEEDEMPETMRPAAPAPIPVDAGMLTLDERARLAGALRDAMAASPMTTDQIAGDLWTSATSLRRALAALEDPDYPPERFAAHYDERLGRLCALLDVDPDVAACGVESVATQTIVRVAPAVDPEDDARVDRMLAHHAREVMQATSLEGAPPPAFSARQYSRVSLTPTPAAQLGRYILRQLAHDDADCLTALNLIEAEGLAVVRQDVRERLAAYAREVADRAGVGSSLEVLRGLVVTPSDADCG